MESHSQILQRKIELVMPRLQVAADRMWKHPRLAEFYADVMLVVHSVIRATHPSMKAAARCAQDLAESDPVAAVIAPYLAEHAEEERGHDEWALEDLEVLGVAREEVSRRIPSPVVSALVGSQYYWMFHYHPVAYLSYIAVLEGPASIGFLEETLLRTRLPREAFRTYFYHARLDPRHVLEFSRMLDRLPLGEWHHSIMGVNAFHTADLLGRVYLDVVERFEARRPAHAPAR